MVENTLISWAHDTFNPWEGCTRISPACDHCYAAERAHRFGNDHLWAGQLRRTSPANWRKPLKWNREAAASGKPRRVFCASLADVFDNQAPQAWRDDLWALIEATPHLTWMLLTKRPQKIVGMVPPTWLIQPPANVWYGTTIENRETLAQRAHHLAAVPAELRFWSCEPLLEDLGDLFDCLLDISLIIAGGESGSKARPSHPDWFHSLRDQCRDAEIAFHFKQWGAWVPTPGTDGFWPHDKPGACRLLPSGERHPRGKSLQRVGKQQAGRRLDGVIHDAIPGEAAEA